MNSLDAISPIDGRYANKTESLRKYFSEHALIKYRVRVEIEYFIALCELPLPQLKSFDSSLYPKLRAIYVDFSIEDAQKIKSIESITNHDVKAVEYFIKDRMDNLDLKASKEFIHFGLTSQDINNTAIPLTLLEAVQDVYIPQLEDILEKIKTKAKEWKDIPMLARTHGQPASPTRLGKEFEVFEVRLQEQLNQLKTIPSSAKFGGATGNFNAHKVAYPNIDWKAFGKDFVERRLKLKHSFPTTQIEHYDNMASSFDAMKRINTILLDLNKDIWSYVSMDYFKQKIKKGEIGSSAMPHKVNPIDFENSEGNLGIANALLEHLSAKLPISRLQRDLTDSTVLRNLGVPLGHMLIALQSTGKGLDKLVLNPDKIQADLNANWAVVAEAIQTILRREGFENPYEALKGLTRTHSKIDEKSILSFIDTLDVSGIIKAELKAITPSNYTGI
ncbi:adenylosuccinate lyase PurB [Psychroflexus torquis ATCC 700755]|uniref:Adenylosuccinate lyase n=1 Tax=Psychroflexus torquis (strain ATCC 700755 / CIP 106069 / ACAM 623) TaxID=313595 RepID=K4ILZ2_PSYTT|nr:adenylosuccinate lyase [Psychroflexus torquis]AFU70081.1 adenylosuccinate lyase PurB [Psychroflexus torquis ATCC 700755]